MNIYQDCFDLIHQYIFGGAELTANMDLICVALSSFACIFVFSLPFLIVWKVIKLICGG